MLWDNFNCCKWPNIQSSSGHTVNDGQVQFGMWLKWFPERLFKLAECVPEYVLYRIPVHNTEPQEQFTPEASVYKFSQHFVFRK